MKGSVVVDRLRQLRADLRTRAAGLFARRRLRARVDEEMQFHLEMRVTRLVEAGLPEDEARARAAREFGRTLALRERTADTWRYSAMETFWQDVRYALRALGRAPAFTCVAVLSLALGIGANTAIFSLIDRVLLRQLPVRDPHELVLFADSQSFRHYEYFRDRGGDVFRGVTAFTDVSRVAVDGGDEGGGFAEGRLVAGTYFELLGVRPRLGRLLLPADDRVPGGHPVVVISHAFWRRYFNADPAILGRTIRLSPGSVAAASTSEFDSADGAAPAAADGRFAIVGVAPPGFTGETVGQHPDFWTPLMMQPHFLPGRTWLARSTTSWLSLMARVAPGVTRERAQATVDLLLRRALLDEAGATLTEADRQAIAREHIELRDGGKGDSRVRETAARPLVVLMVMVAVVLLIACANLANLLLARGSARARELSVRLALGASRARIVRQLVTESAVLGLLGGAGAIAVGQWGGRALFAMVSEGDTAARLDIGPDARMLAFTAAVAALTVLLFGLVPALRGTRLDVNRALTTGRQGGGGLGGRAMARGLVALQVALSVVLLIGAVLFARTLYNMKAQDYGYEPERLVLMRVDPVSGGYTGDEIGRVCTTLLDAIRALPGVRAATYSENGLFSGTESGIHVTVDGYQAADDRARQVRFDQVGPGYFTGLGIPLVAGRDFTADDRAGAPRVAIVNEQMARFYFGDRNPVGQRITPNSFGAPLSLTIIGVARDARDHNLRDEVRRRMYVSFLQPIDGLTGAKYAVRSHVDPAVMARQLRAAVAQVAPRMPIEHITPVTTLVDRTLLRERMVATLSLLLGLVAVALASIGLYGVLTCVVVRRTNEIGIRMAIGAFPRDIVWMIVRETLALVLAGAAVGVPAALALGQYVESLLFGLAPHDAWTLAGVLVLMAIVALAAAILPARRAAAVDPLRALRCD